MEKIVEYRVYVKWSDGSWSASWPVKTRKEAQDIIDRTRLEDFSKDERCPKSFEIQSRFITRSKWRVEKGEK